MYDVFKEAKVKIPALEKGSKEAAELINQMAMKAAFEPFARSHLFWAKFWEAVLVYLWVFLSCLAWMIWC